MANTTLPALLEREKDNILGRFPSLNTWMTPEIFWQVIESLRTNAKLAEAAATNPNSVVTALIDLASWGLPPDGREAFVNVYRIDGVPTAQAQWIWQGGVRRAVDMGVIAHAVADVIRQGDEITEVVDKTGRHLSHKRDISKKNREVIGSYALFWLKNGLVDYELCDLEDIERAKAASMRQMNGKVSPAWQHAYPEQAKKTAIRRGLKRMVGKRDPGFIKMMETEFDAETTGRENPGELAPHEIPQAVEDGEAGTTTPEAQSPTSGTPPVVVVVDECQGDGDTPPSPPSGGGEEMSPDEMLAYVNARTSSSKKFQAAFAQIQAFLAKQKISFTGTYKSVPPQYFGAIRDLVDSL